MDAPGEPLQYLVVLGSSAGGLQALTAIIDRLPKDFPAPVLVAQHLDPNRPSHLAAILGRRANLHLVAVSDRMDLEAGNVYVLPPDRHLLIQDRAIVPGGDGEPRPSPSIDHVLTSAAQAYGEGVIAVILSGGGSDGAVGAREVKAAGGTVVIQNPDTATYPSMPQAIAGSIVDVVADSDAIAPLLEELVAAPTRPRRGGEEQLLQAFLDQVRERSGIDFGSYKRGTILRRLQRRMVATGTRKLRDYVAYLAGHPDEYQRLTSTFLIKVTEFFRDADLFEALRDDFLPKLIADARERDRELRLWSAGCATGEEAYSLAMLVADALGDEIGQFNVRIFATDVDLDAVAFARRGIYAAAALARVPEDVRERHFVPVGDRYEVKKGVRSLVIFGQHDLGHRAPFPRVDLALCRNVLIYFTPDLQKRALQLFAFALRDGGYLALGKAESTSPLPQHFVLVQPRLKLYRRQGERVLIPPARIRDTSPMLPTRLVGRRAEPWRDLGLRGQEGRGGQPDRAERILMQLPIGVVVVNDDYDVQSINASARRLLGIHGQAVGDDLVHLLDDEPGQKVRGLIDAVARGKALPVLFDLTTPRGAESETHSIEIAGERLANAAEGGGLVLLAVVDVTSWSSRRFELEAAAQRDAREGARLGDQVRSLGQANQELLLANQELTTVNAELRNANEELLVANEEVQAATEEVETLNEELQATNEELETLNEELQATVEELNATNEDLEARSVELQETAAVADAARTEADLQRVRMVTILDALDQPLLIVDGQGATVTANRAFRASVGDPAGLKLLGADGQALPPSADPRRRVGGKRWKGPVHVGERVFEVTSNPIDSPDGPYAALLFREVSR
jgi:two-component system CheB/CheR fusion protein